MYTSGKRILGDLFWNIIAAAFTAFFGAVYEHYSHEVYSYFMIYAFAFPLIMGVLPYSIIIARGIRSPREACLWLWNSAIAAFTVGSVFKGVLDIYGTTNRLVYIYPAAGTMLIVMAIIAAFKPHKATKVREV